MFGREEPAASRVLVWTHYGNRLVPLKMAIRKCISFHCIKWDNLTWGSCLSTGCALLINEVYQHLKNIFNKSVLRM
jgi:5-methylcytosine-specific restriction endonuclease McrA